MNFVTSKHIEKYTKKYQPQYFIELGMRSNGKSSATKTFCVDQFLKNKHKFVYMRRYSIDMKNWMIERYFENVPGFDIEELTGIPDAFIHSKQGELFIAHREGKKIIIDDSIGYSVALSDIEHMKSINFPNVKYMIFEEFVTSESYLQNECQKFLNMVSTIFRGNIGCVYMVANTISTVNPYFREFQLTNISSQKVGTIDTYINEQTKCIVWLTSPLEETENDKTSMFFGERGKMINTGEWDRDEKRKLEYDYKKYTRLYELVFKFHDKMFFMELLEYKNNHVWYVTPKTSPIQKNTRIISDSDIENDLCTIGFIPMHENEVRAFNLLKQGKIAYVDNLTGTEFIQCYRQMERGLK